MFTYNNSILRVNAWWRFICLPFENMGYYITSHSCTIITSCQNKQDQVRITTRMLACTPSITFIPSRFALYFIHTGHFSHSNTLYAHTYLYPAPIYKKQMIIRRIFHNKNLQVVHSGGKEMLYISCMFAGQIVLLLPLSIIPLTYALAVTGKKATTVCVLYVYMY